MENKKISIAKQKAIFEQTIQASPDELIIVRLEELRENGEDYMIETITGLLFTSRGDILKDSVANFLVDVKNQSSVPVMIKAIKENLHSADIARLVSVCWQSRLNFSSDIDLFVELLCKSDYQTSIEAFTVIENSMESVAREKLVEIIGTLEIGKKKASIEKKSLIEETIKVINEFLAL